MSRKASKQTRAHGSQLPLGSHTVPAGPNPLVARADALCQQGRLGEAEALVCGILSFAPREHTALHTLGFIAQQRGDHIRAVDLFQQAIAISGRVAAYHGNLGNAYFKTHRFSEAADAYRRALTLEPRLSPARFGLGLALLAQKAYSAAAKELEAAVKARPGHSDTHLNLGIALTELGRIDEAVVHCRRAVALSPGYAGGHLRLGIALRAKAELREACGHLARAIDSTPNSLKPIISSVSHIAR